MRPPSFVTRLACNRSVADRRPAGDACRGAEWSALSAGRVVADGTSPWSSVFRCSRVSCPCLSAPRWQPKSA